jgi:hypothetical protein
VKLVEFRERNLAAAALRLIEHDAKQSRLDDTGQHK